MTRHRTREEQVHALASKLAGVRCIGAFERESAERTIREVENRVHAELRAENERFREAMAEAYETYVDTPEDVADIDDRFERIGSILERVLDGAPKMSSDRTDRERLDAVPSLIVQRVAELPDRTSPDDGTDMMLVTGGELTDIIYASIADAMQQEEHGDE